MGPGKDIGGKVIFWAIKVVFSLAAAVCLLFLVPLIIFGIIGVALDFLIDTEEIKH